VHYSGRGSKNGAAAESLLVFHLLYTSYAIGITKSTSLFIQEGPWALLKPSQLFGLDYLNLFRMLSSGVYYLT
jgi:hypothetical protein